MADEHPQQQTGAYAYKNPLFLALDAGLDAAGTQPSVPGNAMLYRPAHAFMRNRGRYTVSLVDPPAGAADSQWSGYTTNHRGWTCRLFYSVGSDGIERTSGSVGDSRAYPTRKEAHRAFNSVPREIKTPPVGEGEVLLITLSMICGYRDNAGRMLIKVRELTD